MGNEDYYNGFLGALGVVAALEQRARTGTGLYLESPQLHSALFATTHEFVDAAGALVPGAAARRDPDRVLAVVPHLRGRRRVGRRRLHDERRRSRRSPASLGMDAASILDGGDDVAALVAKQLADEPADAVAGPAGSRRRAVRAGRRGAVHAGVPVGRVGPGERPDLRAAPRPARLDPRGRPDDPPVAGTRAATRARARCSASTAGRSSPRSASRPTRSRRWSAPW